MTTRTSIMLALTSAALGLGACGGEPAPVPREAGSDPLGLAAVQEGPESTVVTVHWLGPDCSEVEAEPEEDSRRVTITLSQPRAASCSGRRSAQSIGLPLERGVAGRQIIDGRTKETLTLATCRAPGMVAAAIRRSICRVERRARRDK